MRVPAVTEVVNAKPRKALAAPFALELEVGLGAALVPPVLIALA